MAWYEKNYRRNLIAVSYTHLDVYKRQAVPVPDSVANFTVRLFILSDAGFVPDFPHGLERFSRGQFYWSSEFCQTLQER